MPEQIFLNELTRDCAFICNSTSYTENRRKFYNNSATQNGVTAMERLVSADVFSARWMRHNANHVTVSMFRIINNSFNTQKYKLHFY